MQNAVHGILSVSGFNIHRPVSMNQINILSSIRLLAPTSLTDRSWDFDAESFGYVHYVTPITRFHGDRHGKELPLYPFDPYLLRSGSPSKPGSMREVTTGSDNNNNFTTLTIAPWPAAIKTTQILHMHVCSYLFGPRTTNSPKLKSHAYIEENPR